jgi:Putative motility protein
MDVAEMMVNMRATQTQSLVQFAVVKKSHEMQMDLINMLSEVARSAPPLGQGTRVDKSA